METFLAFVRVAKREITGQSVAKCYYVSKELLGLQNTIRNLISTASLGRQNYKLEILAFGLTF